MLKKLWSRIKTRKHCLSSSDEAWLFYYAAAYFTEKEEDIETYNKVLERIISFSQGYIVRELASFSVKQRARRWAQESVWLLDCRNSAVHVIDCLTKNVPLYSLASDYDLFEDSDNAFIFHKILPGYQYRLSVLILLLFKPDWIKQYFSIEESDKANLCFTREIIKELGKRRPLVKEEPESCGAIEKKLTDFVIISILSHSSLLKEQQTKKRLLS